jgi:hypothetical protein
VTAQRRRLILGLVTVLLLDAVFDCLPTKWIKNSLEHFGLPVEVRFSLAAIKGASAAGLVIGTRRPTLGRITAVALIGYFLAALGFHARARDPLTHHLPAAAMLGWSGMVLRAFDQPIAGSVRKTSP